MTNPIKAPTMSQENNKVIVGQKVMFAYYDHDKCKDVDGRGWVKEIDTDNNQIIIQTTRGVIWVETDGVKPLNTTPQ